MNLNDDNEQRVETLFQNGAAADVLNNPGNEYTQHLIRAVLPPSFAARELRPSFRKGHRP